MSAKVAKPLAVAPKSMAPLLLLFVCVALVTFVVMMSSQKEKDAAAQAPRVPVVSVAADLPMSEVAREVPSALNEDSPHAAFPSMSAESGDADAELASAFTYENLQESMLSSGQEAREAMKSRAAWSRFGERSNPEVWEAQMAEIKREIQASGQTLEQFMENTWAPIPEQMASFWKDAAEAEQRPEVKSERLQPAPSRAALSEAPSLTRDAVQPIAKDDAATALRRMNEILAARKRAKALKLRLPEVTEEQKADLAHWARSGDEKLAGASRAVSSV